MDKAVFLKGNLNLIVYLAPKIYLFFINNCEYFVQSYSYCTIYFLPKWIVNFFNPYPLR